ncbi:hypothetical protein HZA38_03175 [Candidatus Peregrinibacteria bacterium]|nr:hypothetical protein [Candidatus Peregrinibacteria bacterium]
MATEPETKESAEEQFFSAFQDDCDVDYIKQNPNPYCDTVLEEPDHEKAFEEIRTKYHEDTNTFLNEHISKIEGTTFRCDAKREFTALETSFEEIYFERKIELYKYTAALRRLFEFPEAPSGNTFTEVLNSAQYFSERIDREIDISEKVLRIAVQSYAEMRLYYPLHKELECLAYDLQKLRDSWEFFGEQISRMPAKFINASAQF